MSTSIHTTDTTAGTVTRPLRSAPGGSGENRLEAANGSRTDLLAGPVILDKALVIANATDHKFQVTSDAWTGPAGIVVTAADNSNDNSILEYGLLTGPSFAGDMTFRSAYFVCPFTLPGAGSTVRLGLGSGSLVLEGGVAEVRPTAATGTDWSGMVTITNAIRVTAAGGRLGAACDSTSKRIPVTFSGPITLAGRLDVGTVFALFGDPLARVFYSGSVTIDQAVAAERGFNSYYRGDRHAEVYLDGNVADGPGGAGNALRLRNQSNFDGGNWPILYVRGNGNTYSGGTIIEPAWGRRNWVEVAPGSRFGTGSITVQPSGRISFAEAASKQAGQILELQSTAVGGWSALRVVANQQVATSPTSRFIHCCDNLTAATAHTVPDDLSSLGDGYCYLGSSFDSTTASQYALYDGSQLAPGADNTYRLGGGSGRLQVLRSVLTGTARLVIGHPWAGGDGTVWLNAPQTYAGGTEVTAGSTLIGVVSNGVSPFGSGPISGGGGPITLRNAGNLSAETVALPELVYSNSTQFTHDRNGKTQNAAFTAIRRAPGGVLRFAAGTAELGTNVKVRVLAGLPAFAGRLADGTEVLPSHIVCNNADADIRLARYDATLGILPMAWTLSATTAEALMAAATNDTVYLNNTTPTYAEGIYATLTRDLTVYAIAMKEWRHKLDGPFTLKLLGGTIIARQNDHRYYMSRLDFNGREAVIHTWGNTSVAISAAITNANGLVKAGHAGRLELQNSANDFGGGPVFVHGGELRVKDRTVPDGTRLHLARGAALYANETPNPHVYLGGLHGHGRIYNGYSGFVIHVDVPTDEADVFEGSFQTQASLEKTGDGRMVLAGASSTVGGFTVDGGRLEVDGSWGGAGVVHAGATLGGAGTIAGALICDGTVAPGGIDHIGTLQVGGNLALSSTANYRARIDTQTSDLLNVAGSVTLADAELNLTALAGALEGTRTILTAGTLSGTFHELPEGASVLVGDNAKATISYSGNAVTLLNIASTGGTSVIVR